jgi:hypothetical protein
MEKLVNLTPHAVVLSGGPSLPPSGSIARCSQVSSPAGEFEGIPLSRTVFGAVEGLPEPAPGVMFLVSALVRGAVPHRKDVASPGELVRDPEGRVVGCKGLIVN